MHMVLHYATVHCLIYLVFFYYIKVSGILSGNKLIKTI